MISISLMRVTIDFIKLARCAVTFSNRIHFWKYRNQSKRKTLHRTVFIDSLIKKIHTNIGFLQSVIKDGAFSEKSILANPYLIMSSCKWLPCHVLWERIIVEYTTYLEKCHRSTDLNSFHDRTRLLC